MRRNCVLGLVTLTLSVALFSRPAISAQSSSAIPPELSNGQPTGTLPAGTTKTTMSLATNQHATCRYATTAGTAYTAMTATFSSTGGPQHVTELNGLVGGNRYTYYVRCRGTNGAANSNDFRISFSVAAGTPPTPSPTPNPTPPPAATSPTIAITTPASGAKLAGKEVIRATLSERTGITSVTFLVDAAVIGTDTTWPYSFFWDTSDVAPGAHSLRAQARHASGTVVTSPALTVTVSDDDQEPDNGPPSPDATSPRIVITTPDSGAKLAGKEVIRATLSERAGITSVTFLVDAAVIGTDTTWPYSFFWDTSDVAPGAHSIRAQARHAGGTVVTSPAVTVTVSDEGREPENRPPSVTMTSPTAGTSYPAPATVTVAADATDLDGTIARVDFYVGSTRIGSDTTRPFSTTWSASDPGTYSLSASAVDSDGATTRAPSVSVTVSGPSASSAKAIFEPSIPDSAVSRYVLDIFRSGRDLTSPVATQDLGKPSATGGEITADISRTLASLSDGTYVATVTAVSSTDRARSEPSPPFVVKSGGKSSAAMISYASDTVDPAPSNPPASADDGRSAETADIAGSNGTLWVTDASTSLVTALDATTGDVLATIPVGLRPRGVVAPDGLSKVYVADEGSDTVSVISKTTMTVVATIPLPSPNGRQPHHVSASSDGRFVYVGERGSNVVDVIDTATDQVSARFAAGWPGSKTLAVVPDAAGELLYAINRGTSPARSTLTALEASSGNVRWQMPIDDPRHFLIGPDGRTGLLSHDGRGNITVIDLEGRTVINEINLGASAEIDTLQLSSNGRYLLARVRAANAALNILDLMDTSVRTVSLRPVASSMTSSATEPMYIPVSDSSEFPAGVIVVDAAAQRVVRQFTLPGRGTPHAAVFDGAR